MTISNKDIFMAYVSMEKPLGMDTGQYFYNPFTHLIVLILHLDGRASELSYQSKKVHLLYNQLLSISGYSVLVMVPMPYTS